MFNIAPHGKELSEDLRIRIVALHKDGRGYKKFGNSLELSYSTVARVIQMFSKTGFTRNRPRKGRSKKLSPCAVHQVQKLASKNRCMSAASIALEVAEVEGQLVSAQTIHHTLQQVGLHGRSPRRKSLLKLAHKKACKQFAEDKLAKSMNYWNHVLWFDESKVNLFDSDGVQHVWWLPGEEYQENCALPTVKHGGGSIMVWGLHDYCWYCGAAVHWGFQHVLWHLKQKIMPSLQKLCRTAVFQHNNDPKHTINRTYYCLADEAEVEGDGVAKYVSRPEPYWAHVGSSSSGRGRSTMCQTSSSSVMSLWRSGRGCRNTCAALVNSMPRGIKAVLDNNGAPTNIDNLDTVLTCSLRVYSFLLPVIWTIMTICWVIFRGQYICTSIQAAHWQL